VRITSHPILEFEKKKEIPFTFDGKKYSGFEGESIAAALHANNIKTLSHSLRYDRPRGFFCGIGKCSSCFMTVDDIPNIRTCIVPVRPEMRITEQGKLGKLPHTKYTQKKKEVLNHEIVVVGGGPAGLCAALAAAEQGAQVLLIDENTNLGGQLVKQTHKFFGSTEEKAGTRGIDIAKGLVEELKKKTNIKFLSETTVVGYYDNVQGHRILAVKRLLDGDQLIDITCKGLIMCLGALENMLAFPGNDLPGVYGAGGVQTLMNVYGVRPGDHVLMVGAGNVGLIVSYQLLQAGVFVDRVVEAMPRIGGYHVHAAKLRRCGVPIYTSSTIKQAFGKDHVEGAVVAAVDESFQPIPGTEETIVCDTICLAVGLTPSVRLLEQAQVRSEFIPEAGGRVALHNHMLETTKKAMYVAGDASGIEEASTAMIEGQLAGISAAYTLGHDMNAKEQQKKCNDALRLFRAGPFGRIPRECKEKIAHCLTCDEGVTRY
jgi:sarcosine oxidase, subunit alpha